MTMNTNISSNVSDTWRQLSKVQASAPTHPNQITTSVAKDN